MQLKNAFLTLALGGIALTQSGFAGADIYKCMQADGTPLYTNVPEDPRCQLHLKLDKEPSAVSKIASSSGRASSVGRATKPSSSADRSLE